MSIKIQIETPAIPIEIGELKFEFDTSDESIMKFRNNAPSVIEELEKTELEDGDLEGVKETLRKGYDMMLGKGAFDKIYKQTPSILLVAKYFAQLGDAIAEKLNEMGKGESQVEKAQKYVRNKKKK